MTIERGRSRLQGIQALRGIAAVSVVFVHSITRTSLSFPLESHSSRFMTLAGTQWTIGDAGVDLFFVISGFIMFHVHRHDFGQPGAQFRFLRKRLLRILPLYWIATSVMVALLVFKPAIFANQHDIADPAWVVSSYLLVPYPTSAGVLSPVIGVGWTLVYEAFFYALFVVALAMRARNGLSLLVLTLGGLVLFGALLSPAAFLLRFATDWLLMDFLAGVLVAWFVSTGTGLPSAGRVLLVVAAVACIATTANRPPAEHGVVRLLLWGVPSALLVLALNDAPLPPGRTGRFLNLLGDSSYSIYIMQVFALPAWGLVIKRTIGDQCPFDMNVLMLTILGTASGIACWYAVERPTAVLLRRNLARRQRVADARIGAA